MLATKTLNYLTLFINNILFVCLLTITAEFQVSDQKISAYLVEAFSSSYRSSGLNTVNINNNAAVVGVASGSNGANNNPFWSKPGCHKLGHTREISIAGCVKFNLSTNACRGYCMSYSIPASEEHNSLTENSLIGPNGAAISTVGLGISESPYELLSSTASSTPEQGTSDMNNNLNNLNNNQELEQFQQQQQQHQSHDNMKKSQQKQINSYLASTLTASTSGNKLLSPSSSDLIVTTLAPATIAAASSQQQQQQSIGPLLGGGDPLRRDVVSVSQCCNMMETEDVIVNLRCGVNETKRLVFKSAKTCECFFCKHV